jgi:hypothetical protein
MVYLLYGKRHKKWTPSVSILVGEEKTPTFVGATTKGVSEVEGCPQKQISCVGNQRRKDWKEKSELERWSVFNSWSCFGSRTRTSIQELFGACLRASFGYGEAFGAFFKGVRDRASYRWGSTEQQCGEFICNKQVRKFFGTWFGQSTFEGFMGRWNYKI